MHKYERDRCRTKIMHLCRVKLYSHYANIGEQEVVTGKSPYGRRRRSHTRALNVSLNVQGRTEVGS